MFEKLPDASAFYFVKRGPIPSEQEFFSDLWQVTVLTPLESLAMITKSNSFESPQLYLFVFNFKQQHDSTFKVRKLPQSNTIYVVLMYQRFVSNGHYCRQYENVIKSTKSKLNANDHSLSYVHIIPVISDFCMKYLLQFPK